MTAHLRSVLDTRGDTVDLAWFCSRFCWLPSIEAEPPSETFEEGGAYPCGAEHDSADYCATCGETIGNPLTDVGAENVREYVADVESGSHPWRVGAEHEARAESLRRVYPYLFDSEPEPCRYCGGTERTLGAFGLPEVPYCETCGEVPYPLDRA